MYRLPGKVHGSLARAGKVRGQTSKVSRQVLITCEILLSFTRLSQYGITFLPLYINTIIVVFLF
uniref:40S ribosomal protein S30 n=1 Tax=Anguilla anguilla TaxID=7936 RepID=A0A0E9SZM5_ANGAN